MSGSTSGSVSGSVSETEQRLTRALWRIYRRPERPALWVDGGNLPWNEPDFSRRMLAEHLDESHGAASRQTAERLALIDWLWDKLGLNPGSHLLDFTCGPGLYAVELASRGCVVTGIDFSPASIAYARELAEKHDVADKCTFIEQDVREAELPEAAYDSALFIYGQLAVFPKDEARTLLERIRRSLRPGGRLYVELLDPDKIDKSDGTWWYTDDKGLWGETPFLHLGERFCIEEEKSSVERFQILDLESGELAETTLCDQSYEAAEMTAMMTEVGFNQVDVYPAWDSVPMNDEGEWIGYVATAS
jgi:SAM-dependent methyltransferase